MDKGGKKMKRIDKWIIHSAMRLGSGLKEDNRGMGTVEIILIIVVLVGVVVIFKNQLNQLVESLFSKIFTQTNKL